MRTTIVMAVLALAACGKEAQVEPSCVMNGFGQGTCTFTNTGEGEGALCGSIVVLGKPSNTQVLSTALFCSGKVAAKSTTKVEFTVPGTNEACDSSHLEGEDRSWQDVCAFTFLPQGKRLEDVTLDTN